MVVLGCNDSTSSNKGKEKIDVTFPTSATVWTENQTDTYCEWDESDASGNVYIEIYNAGVLTGIYHVETTNSGHADRIDELGSWGTGSDFRLKVIDSDENWGWSDYFTITEESTGEITVSYPNTSTVWQEYQTNTYCDWSGATGEEVTIEIYKGDVYAGLYQNQTTNDGHCTRQEALGDWGSGDDFQLKLIDANENVGWSAYFTIEAFTPIQIAVTTPSSSTIWHEYETETECDWSGATGDSIFIQIYQGGEYLDEYHDWTGNDGHCSRNDALKNWGTGDDFQLKVIDSDGNFGMSEEFSIIVLTDPIEITYPNSTVVWQEFEEETYCDWLNATGSTVYIEIWKGSVYMGVYQDETDNDGHCTRQDALGDWGTGSNFRLKLIDANENVGWSEYFTIE